jgi:hypothetical protein
VQLRERPIGRPAAVLLCGSLESRFSGTHTSIATIAPDLEKALAFYHSVQATRYIREAEALLAASQSESEKATSRAEPIAALLASAVLFAVASCARWTGAPAALAALARTTSISPSR